MKITNETKLISSIAAKQSPLGAAMHNSAFEYLKLNYIYIPLTVSDCKNAIKGIKALNFRGTTVSMPHKQEVMKYLDKIDKTAKDIGAVNTVSNDSWKLTGYNSDWIGAMEALKEVTKLKNKNVVLLGAGGAARAIAYGLNQNHSKVIIFNRTAKKGENLAKTFSHKFGGILKNFKDVSDYDILINATSLGFSDKEGKTAIDTNLLKNNKIVLDVVISPLETPFLKAAKKKGNTIISGYRMLIYQALFQFELFTGKKPPFKVMEKALLKLLT